MATNPVHPHACGEISPPILFTGKQLGTSPRLWGDSSRICPALTARRYIPTLVGRFNSLCVLKGQPAVHPHACGEIEVGGLFDIANSGTSPRLWGDSTSARMMSQRRRYIPTLVGRLQYRASATCLIPVHPHACGEIPTAPSRTGRRYGTSPRLWGDSHSRPRRTSRLRYIPTLVGRLPCRENVR